MYRLSVGFFLIFSTMIGFAAPLPAKNAFQFSIKHIDGNTFTLNWKIHSGYFLYKNRIKLTESSTTHAALGRIDLPEAVQTADKLGRHYAVYRNQLILPVPVLGKTPGEQLLHLHFQGCSDAGFCYPPENRELKLTINTDLALAAVEFEHPSIQASISDSTPVQTNQWSHALASHNWFMIGLSFLGFGLLLSLTPCVLPMIPVLSGIIIGHGQTISTRKALLLSVCYVLSMSITYSLIGAIIALLGKNLQIMMQSPWAIGSFGCLFIVLALSMFNFYELHLPLKWQNKFARITRHQASGHYVNAAIMGCMSILVLSPCVTPPMIGVLTYVAQDGNIMLGMLALFCVGLGMGAPLIIIGTSAGTLLPKAGQWMNAVKSLFGILFLAVAIYLFSRIVPPFVSMCLWASLFVFTGIMLGAIRKANSNREKLRQGLGIILFVYGLLILIGASQGHKNPLQPLSNGPMESQSKTIVSTVAQAQDALAKARGKPVILDFYADWCTACKIFVATTLRDAEVQRRLKNIEWIEVDLSANDASTQGLLSYFHVIAPPTFIFYDIHGHELIQLRQIGEVGPKEFLSAIHQLDALKGSQHE